MRRPYLRSACLSPAVNNPKVSGRHLAGRAPGGGGTGMSYKPNFNAPVVAAAVAGPGKTLLRPRHTSTWASSWGVSPPLPSLRSLGLGRPGEENGQAERHCPLAGRPASTAPPPPAAAAGYAKVRAPPG